MVGVYLAGVISGIALTICFVLSNHISGKHSWEFDGPWFFWMVVLFTITTGIITAAAFMNVGAKFP